MKRLAARALIVLAAFAIAPAAHAQQPKAGSAEADAPPAPWSWGWTARGFAGGLLLGPIGTVVAFRMAGDSPVGPPVADRYDAALAERIRNRRREAAFVGGMVGTGIMIYALLQVVDLEGAADGAGSGPPGGETF